MNKIIMLNNFGYFSKCVVFTCFFYISSFANAQNNIVEFKVVNSGNQEVDYATVIIQSNTCKYLCSALTDSLGQFKINAKIEYPCMIIVRHLSYENDTTKIIDSSQIPARIVLHERANILNKVIIIGERPMMKIDQGKFVYNMESVLKDKIALNAYEAIKEIPGVIEEGGALMLVGGTTAKIVINGEVSTMDNQKLTALLKSTSATKVKGIEVNFLAPAKYNVSGGLINVLLNKDINGSYLSGEAQVGYAQSYYPSSYQNMSVTYKNKKLTIDLLGGINSGNGWNKSISYTYHELKNIRNEIDENITNTNNWFSFNSRVGVNYDFATDSKLTLSYFVQGNKTICNNYSDASFKGIDNYSSQSNTNNRDESNMHDLYLGYNCRGFSAGVNYMFYNNPTTVYYSALRKVFFHDETKSDYNQRINRYSMFVNKECKIISEISLNYGADLYRAISNSDISHFTNKDANYINDGNSAGEQTETVAHGFGEMKAKIGKKLSLTAALKIEYFKSDYNYNGALSTLWKDWTVFPTASVNYACNKINNVQLNISSNKRYPSYWSINPQTTNISSYSVIEGNPQLKPSNSYMGKLIYTYKMKYMLIGSFLYTAKSIIQTPHMSVDELKTIYKYENFDYRTNSGISLVIPFKIIPIMSSRLTLSGNMIHEKMAEFYGSSIDNIFYNAGVKLSNSIKISPKWLLQLTGDYSSPTRQGVFRLGYSLDAATRLKYTISKNSSLVLAYDNIFCRAMPHTLETIYGNQYKCSHEYNKSSFSLSFLWRFNKYKETEYKLADSERLGK